MFVFIKKVFFTGLVFVPSLVSTTTLNHKNGDECIFYIMLFSIFFTAGIGTYFVYCKYANSNEENVSIYDYVCQAKNY